MQYVRAKTNDGRTIADFILSVMADTNRKLDQRMEAGRSRVRQAVAGARARRES
jgi:hypothetical protein